MKKILMTGLLMFASNWFKKLNPYSHASFDLTRLKIAMGYLQTIKTLRMLSLSLLGAGVSLVLLFSGIILFHLAVIFLAPWTVQTKLAITLGCGLLYVGSAGAVFYYVFSEEKWLKIFNADKMIDEISGKQLSGEDQQTKNTTEQEGTEFARRSSL